MLFLKLFQIVLAPIRGQSWFPLYSHR